ncbi:terminase large subunit domain-containing protein [Paraburkholderia dilworthii]|uniref:terminase large subunit domain-containing protein n=1 Tax=Paraburkholderia dilworthii TaxID=948106 RepID=UPI0006873255|nr:terminase family protein [Paraburkholderia dilworthii]
MTNSPLSPQEAARELLIRRKAREDILHYVNAIDVPGKPATDDPDTEFFEPIETTLADHHRLLLTKLDEVSNKEHGRMMVFMPPGSAKSTYASVVFPSRFLGQKPNRKVILASYGDDLARKMGRRTRSIIRQKRFKGIFGCELTSDSAAAQEFSLTNGSEYMACGIMSGITGNRAHGIIIDDPVKGREQADSPTIRDKTWSAYEDDLKTRLIPGGWIVVIQTRWHEDDLSGRILPEDWKGESGPILCRDGNVWEVVCLQARCEVQNDPLGRKIGEYLWPEWFTEKHWAQFQSNVRTWASLYQQLPRPLEGSLFQLANMLVDGAPVPMPTHCDYVFAVLDSALKAGDKNDGTAVTYFARNRYVGHPLIILDWDITQIESDLIADWFPSIMARVEELAKLTGARLGSAGSFVEDKGSGITLLQRAARSGWPAQAIDSKLTSMSKDARGTGVSDFVHHGKVKLSEHAYNKTVTYKGRTQNHLLSQVFGYRLGIPNQADDAYDTTVYGIAIGLGDSDGL